ncbi:hypothetical protein J437_LFUL000275 [Ladona fulva]|uniref:Uncharacterized protein n=1 Tax=Ladona fulva TaxID=123851 RepID=A0A8K0K331_LADFU|nr:hypothetical protein J437_LFUL000275 [Ladona fulva]
MEDEIQPYESPEKKKKGRKPGRKYVLDIGVVKTMASGLPTKFLATFWWVITIITFIFGAGGLIYVISKLYFRKPLDWSYALIISPYSREVQMVVYTVKESTRDIIVRMDANITFSYHIETMGVNHVFKRKFAAAQRLVPWLSRSSSPIIFAGGDTMRSLRKDKTAFYNQIMDEIRNMLTKSQLKFLPHYMRTLEEWEEALHGWVTANYLSDFLSKGRQAIKAKRDIFTTRNTLGALDFGHTSMHISYEIPRILDHIPIPATVKNNAREITLFGRSNWGKLQQDGLPCYPETDDYTRPGAKYKTKPSRFALYSHKEYVFEACSRTTRMERNYGPKNLVTTVGRPNPETCKDHVKDIIDKCKEEFVYFDCPEFTFPERPYNVIFTGFNEFAAFAELAGLKTGDDKNKWDERRKEICGIKNMEQLTIKFPSRTADKKAYEFLCIAITFLLQILRDKIKLSNEEWKTLRFNHDIDDTRITWLLGYVLNVTSSLPTTSPFHELFTLNAIFIEGLACAAMLTVSSVALSFALRCFGRDMEKNQMLSMYICSYAKT